MWQSREIEELNFQHLDIRAIENQSTEHRTHVLTVIPQG